MAPANARVVIRPWPRWLNVREAAEYSAMSPQRLKRLAQSGEVVGFPDQEDRRGPHGEGRWIFDRKSLDSYREGQAGEGEIAEALGRLRGIRGHGHIQTGK